MTERKEKHKQKFKERGITLIALVITIIVLLILAGVALATLTGDSGILSNSEKAKENTALANAKEQLQLAVQGALTENYAQGNGTITRDNLKTELNSIVGTGKYELSEGEAPWTVTIGDYEAIIYQNGNIAKAGDTKTLPSAEGTTPWLPEGFSQVSGTTLDNGLTITNATGLQNYVWIEVPTTIEQAITLSDGTTKTVKLSNAASDEEISLILEAYVGDYIKGSSSQDYSSWKDEWYDSNGNTASTSTNLEDTAGCGMTYSEYQTAYSNMLNSIKKYGGFWLAQYEAGIAYEEEGATATNRTSHSEITITKANYAKDQYAYNWVNCSEAQKIANEDSTDKYTSSLPFGIQWDLVCKFLEVKNAKTYEEIATNSKWGNYFNTSWTSSATSKYSDDYGKSFKSGSKEKISEEYLLTTGAIEKVTVDSTEYIANPMNIYDLAGNVWEYTLEHDSANAPYYPCAGRGGSYINDRAYIPAAYRYDDISTTDVANYSGGFRSTLFINE